MPQAAYEKEITALLVIDPYNDFISEGGKIWGRIKSVTEANKCVPNMLQILNAARKAGLRVFYALHHRYRPGDYETWKYIAAYPEGCLVAKELRIQVVRCNMFQARSLAADLDDVPHNILRDTFPPYLVGSRHRSKDPSVRDLGRQRTATCLWR